MNSLKRWDTNHCFSMTVVGIIYWFFPWKILFLMVVIPSFLYLLFSEKKTLQKLWPIGGYANWVTLLRLIGLLLLFTLSGSLNNNQVMWILIVFVILDGVDGFLARHFHQETSVGANFDMETDALYVCFVSILLFERGLADSWILLIGFMRYFYVFLVFSSHMHLLAEKRTRFGPTIAVVLFIALLIPFGVPRSIYYPLLIFASVLVILSFVWSFYLLIGERRKLLN